MIPYDKSFIGINLVFHIHGSAVYRGMIPGLISVLIYWIIYKYLSPGMHNELKHPGAISVLISSVSFLIIFRANYGYQRYWEACGAVFQMMSKWMDATVHTGVYHLQQSHYDKIKPPSYHQHHDLNRLNLVRDRQKDIDWDQMSHEEAKSVRNYLKREKSICEPNNSNDKVDLETPPISASFSASGDINYENSFLIGEGRLDGGWQNLFDDDTATFYHTQYGSLDKDKSKGFASTAGGRTPSLFLQELAHLSSLCCAVAFSTLRNDVEGAISPLGVYTPGEPFPHVQLDHDQSFFYKFKNTLRFLSGFDRTPQHRTKYNAERPLPVIGGVSPNEILFLQRAKGPYAKVTLCWNWLSEFIAREHLAGSQGAIGPPIIARTMQFLGDGMLGYNQARKIMFIPFPFPHAQLSALAIVISMFAVPLLMDNYSNEPYLGGVISFLTVTCIASLHEVARELENPFRNVPNDIPLCTLQAMYNESLLTMYSGYHPDHFWDGNEALSSRKIRNRNSNNSHVGKPQSSSASNTTNNNKDTSKSMSLSELQQLVEKQSKEIERLTAYIDNSTVSNSNSSYRSCLGKSE